MEAVKVTHVPVLVNEVLEYLQVNRGQWYLDATVGQGGHALAIQEKGGSIFGIDRDPEAVKTARQRLTGPARSGETGLILKTGRFSELDRLIELAGVTDLAGALFDLGLSSHQLDDPQRGFSFRHDGPLDMRMDPRLTVTAADLVNGLTKKELIKLMKTFGEERQAGKIAEVIVCQRRRKPIQRTGELARLIEKKLGQKRGGIHPATRVFQALRIAVNDELAELQSGLTQAAGLLKKGGVLVVISFHSLEDRLVKQFMKNSPAFQVLTKKPVLPTEAEVYQNPRARSAKLRAAVKLSDH